MYFMNGMNTFATAFVFYYLYGTLILSININELKL